MRSNQFMLQPKACTLKKYKGRGPLFFGVASVPMCVCEWDIPDVGPVGFSSLTLRLHRETQTLQPDCVRHRPSLTGSAMIKSVKTARELASQDHVTTVC